MSQGIEGLTNLARTKCQGCKHHPKNCAPVDIAHPETINITEIVNHAKACLRCRIDPGAGFELEEAKHGDD